MTSVTLGHLARWSGREVPVSFFVQGGFTMVFIAVFGLVALASATRFALHPVHGGARAIGAYGLAVLFASIAGFAVNLDAIGENASRHPEWVEEAGLGLLVLVGVGEALGPVILGFAVLSVVSLLTAVGLRRLPEP